MIFLTDFMSTLFVVNGIIGITTTIILISFLLLSKFGKSKLWQVTATPLASIIGSGFLIAGPVMYTQFGIWSIPMILLINGVAFLIGQAIRTNITYFDPKQEEYAQKKPWLVWIERGSNWMLGASYMIAIAFYSSLLSSFVFNLFHIEHGMTVMGIPSKILINGFTTVILAFVGLYGYFKGLHGLEALEKKAISLNIAVIGGLIISLVIFAIASISGKTHIQYIYDNSPLNFHSFQVLAGLLLITQGFETVKFLGDDYSVSMRKKASIIAQLIAACVYIVFIPLSGPINRSLPHITETAIISVVSTIALGMGLVLSVSAMLSQFGATIADTIGASGLIEEESKRLLNERQAYLPVVGIGIIMLWFFPILDLITHASRAFAAYYLAQTIIATVISYERKKGSQCVLYSLLTILLFVIVIIAKPAH